MKTKLLSSILAFAIFTSCSTSNIVVSQKLLDDVSVMNVKGNAGILINQKIFYGDYSTSAIKRGWTNRTKLSLLGINHEKARQPIEFTQYGPGNSAADIVGSSDYNSNMFDLFKGLQSYVDRFTNGYFGVIIPKNDAATWEVLIENDNSHSALKTETDNGVAVDDRGNMIEIIGTKQLANNNFFTDDRKTFGYELFRKGESIGAVSVIGNGKVWIKNSLDDNEKLIVASIATILITKQNLSEDSNLN